MGGLPGLGAMGGLGPMGTMSGMGGMSGNVGGLMGGLGGGEALFRLALQSSVVCQMSTQLLLLVPAELLQKALVPHGHLVDIAQRCRSQGPLRATPWLHTFCRSEQHSMAPLWALAPPRLLPA